MKEYNIVSVLWLDHIALSDSRLPKDQDEIVAKPTLTVGFLYRETDLTLSVVSQVEPYSDADQTNYIVILKGAVVGIKKYGKIKLRLRRG